MRPHSALWAFIAFMLLFLTAMPTVAQVPQRINFQGMLTDADGIPVADGDYAMTFAIYDAASGGTQRWSETQTVPVAGGVYNVVLGQPGNAIDPADMDGQRYLGVRVGGDLEMIPRQPITATAFALRSAVSDDADTLDGLDATDFATDAHDHGFSDLTGTATDAQIPDTITVNYAAGAGNADTLDGSHADAFALVAHTHSATNITSGTLSTSRYSAYNDLSAEGYLGDASGDVARNNGTRQVNLNADLLDGLSSSAFMSTATDKWVDVAGDTMTGALSVPYLKIDGITAFVADSDENTFLGLTAGQSNTPGAGRLNTFVGYRSGYSNTSGYLNTFIGNESGYANTTGVYNTFVGDYAGHSNTIGNNNTFIGRIAGEANTSGVNNTFIGRGTGNENTDGGNNTFLGMNAGYQNTSGDDNVFLGYRAGRGNLSGENNTFVGNDAGYANTEGGHNTYIGADAGNNISTDDFNTFVGAAAGENSTTGGFNTFVGADAGHNSTGSANAFFGFYAGYANTSGSHNTFLGHWSGRFNTEGEANTFIGYHAGNNNSTGSGNVFAGNNAGYYETGSNKLYIDNSDT